MIAPLLLLQNGTKAIECHSLLADGILASVSALVVVAKNGTDVPGCGSSANPCLTVGYAILNASQPTDVISIMPGIYVEQAISISGSRNLTLQVNSPSSAVTV